MPLPPTRRRPSDPSAADFFVDRQTESEALSSALSAHVKNCDEGLIDDQTFNNIVSFYGMGGIGKTDLSHRLEAWLSGADVQGWGERPKAPHLVLARWELNDSQGNVDAIPLLVSVRSELHRIKPSWPAFDLAFAAYFTSVRPGEQVPVITNNSEYSDGIVGTLSALAEDLGQASLVVSLTSASIRALVRAAKARGKQWAATRTNPEIVELLERCLSEPSASDQRPDLAADVLWQLALEIDNMTIEKRPNLVIFVDHFERLQNAQRGTGEASLNRFVTSLPHALFVITGRDVIDWYRDDRTELDVAGSHRWPGLLPSATTGARQHRLGHLSESDTRTLLVRRNEYENLRVPDAVIETLVKSTGGWPVHIDAVATYARRLREIDADREISAEDLGGSLASVVRRLLDDLPDDERRIFQAACVLPFFDVPLVRAVAGHVDRAAVTRCIARALILENAGSSFPYRVHDEIREVVRSSGDRVRGGWGAEDWREAAGRALEYSRQLFDQAGDRQDDQAQLMAVALAINIGAENEVDPTWIARAVKMGPNITGLRPHIPASDKVPAGNPVRSIVELVELLDPRADDTVITGLDALRKAPIVSREAALWAAYRSRYPLYRYDDAVKRLRDLMDEDDSRTVMYRRQIAVTLVQSRRFEHAMDAAGELPGDGALDIHEMIGRHTGDVTSTTYLERRAQAAKNSRRYQIEVMGTVAQTRARRGSIHPHEIETELVTVRNIGHRSAERDLLIALGYFELYRPVAFAEIMEALAGIRRGRGTSPGEAELMCLRAMATRDHSLAVQAFERASELSFRPASWIATEVYLSSQGLELPEIETQWLDPYDLVRERWLKVAEGIIDRAGDRA